MDEYSASGGDTPTYAVTECSDGIRGRAWGAADDDITHTRCWSITLHVETRQHFHGYTVTGNHLHSNSGHGTLYFHGYGESDSMNTRK